MAFIEVKHLKYRYPHTKALALDDISFTAEKGEIIGIAGANKAGKSTLCCALAGLVPSLFKGAYGGSVTIDGKDAASTPVSTLCRTVGLVFQNPFNQLSGAAETVFEEAAFGLQNLSIPKEEIEQRVTENLALLDLLPYKDRNPFDLSGGQVQRVALASILAMQPEVLLLDEPASQLDPQGAAEVFHAVKKLAKRGISIFLVEQKPDRLASLCQRLLLLKNGRLLASDTPKKLFSEKLCEDAGLEAPFCTTVCKAFGIRDDDGFYPANMKETAARKASFPKEQSDAACEDTNSASIFVSEKNKALQAAAKHAPLFQLSGLCFSYTPKVPVLSGLDLELDARPTAIVGQNGAGKTTLVKLLKGLLKPTGGKLLFRSEDLSQKTVASLAGQIGYVFQNPDDQIFKNEVLKEAMFGPINIGLSKEDAKQRALSALSRMGLSASAGENPYDLDLAERKRLAVASVLAMEPEVLILDEPTIGQDLYGRKQLGEMIQARAQEGKAVYAVLHDMDFAAAYFSRIIVMAHGKVLADGKPADVFYEMEALKKARLEQPQAAQLASQLGYKGRYLTFADFAKLQPSAAI